MRIAFFDSHQYDRSAFTAANRAFAHELVFFDTRLTPATAQLASGFTAVCAFVNDDLSRAVLQVLKDQGCVLSRCAARVLTTWTALLPKSLI
jgi:D-lactate dehydrogenase